MTRELLKTTQALVLDKSGKLIGWKNIFITRDLIGYWDDEEKALIIVKPISKPVLKSETEE